MSESDGRVALVTGGTKGIGLVVVRDLLDANFRVAFSARTASDVEEVMAALSGRGQALGVVADARNPEACEALVSRTVERFGGLDILVNNAGVGRFSPIQEMSLEDWHAQIDTNLNGVFYLLAGRNAFAGGAAYNASKFGLLGMSEAMMLDLRYEGIRVSLIMPGSVATDFGGRPADAKEGWALTPEDVSQAVLDLLRYPGNAHVSRVEMRPSQPPRKK
jgi:NAD(P)-dependent dehydrogenase (short-subunit alcohol dehydrogenase family)